MADIKILSTHAVQEVLCELGPLFERAGGSSLAIDYDPANALKRRIEGGAAFDVVIVTRPVIDALVRQGKVNREACTDIGRSGLGVAVRQGAAKPDITTVDALKRALLAARSLVRSKDGTSGLYFETLLDRLGIANAMHDKIVLGPSGRIAELVARGEAEMAVQQIPELLPVKGVEYVGPLRILPLPKPSLILSPRRPPPRCSTRKDLSRSRVERLCWPRWRGRTACDRSKGSE